MVRSESKKHVYRELEGQGGKGVGGGGGKKIYLESKKD